MSTIKVVCIDQTLAFNNTPVITSGGLNEDFVSFTFCALWSGFTRTAVFWRSEKEVYHQTLDAEDRCQIPPEVTGEDGVIYFGVFGVNAKGVQRTSEVLNYRIHKGAITTGTKPSDPTPDIYTQIMARCQDVKDEVAVERARINNLIKLEEGSTTGDAELADIRVGADGTVHPSAGEAVRHQYLDAIASTAYLEGDVIVAKEELHDIRKGYDGKVYDFAGDAVRGQIAPLAEQIQPLTDAMFGKTTNMIFDTDVDEFETASNGRSQSPMFDISGEPVTVRVNSYNSNGEMPDQAEHPIRLAQYDADKNMIPSDKFRLFPIAADGTVATTGSYMDLLRIEKAQAGESYFSAWIGGGQATITPASGAKYASIYNIFPGVTIDMEIWAGEEVVGDAGLFGEVGLLRNDVDELSEITADIETEVDNIRISSESVESEFDKLFSVELTDLSSYPAAGNYYVRNGVKTASASWVSYEIENNGFSVIKSARLAALAIDAASIYAVSFYNSASVSEMTLIPDASVFFNAGELADESTEEWLFDNIPVPKNCKTIVVSNRQISLETPTAALAKKRIKVPQESFAEFVVQETGSEKYKVMSQKAVTDELKALSANKMPKVTSVDGHYKLCAYKKGEKMIYYWERVESDVEFYGYEATPPGSLSANDAFYYEYLYGIGNQDGAFYKDLLYHETGQGVVNIVNPVTGENVGSYQHDKKDLLTPHGNSVSIIDVDGTPYMYSNIYNNYAGQADEHKGECCVYKMMVTSNADDITFVEGSISGTNGAENNNTSGNRYRTDFISVDTLKSVSFNECQFLVACYDSRRVYLGQLQSDFTSLVKSGQWLAAGTVVDMANIAGVDSAISYIRLVAETTKIPNVTLVFPKPYDTLNQIIKIGFTNNADFWTVSDSRPYGNFILDPTNGFLYVFVLDNASDAIKWHKFNLPSVTDGVYSSAYGCNVVTLETTDILESWTTIYAKYIQGCCLYDSKLWVTNGTGNGVAYLRVIDLNTKAEIAVVNLGEAGITDEPEFVDFYKGVCHYSTLTGMYKLVFV